MKDIAKNKDRITSIQIIKNNKKYVAKFKALVSVYEENFSMFSDKIEVCHPKRSILKDQGMSKSDVTYFRKELEIEISLGHYSDFSNL